MLSPHVSTTVLMACVRKTIACISLLSRARFLVVVIENIDCPDSGMITATDIVNFMLYGHDLFGLGSTYVTFKPHADSEGYVVVFDANSFKAVVMTQGMVEKFVNENKKDK